MRFQVSLSQIRMDADRAHQLGQLHAPGIVGSRETVILELSDLLASAPRQPTTQLIMFMNCSDFITLVL